MRVLDAVPAQREGPRPATAVLHDDPNARVVGFHLAPGQQVPPHSSASTVVVIVVRGAGRFRDADVEVELKAGQAAVFDPGEVHAIAADAEPLAFLAVLAPSPR
jgi:quercetin dioxygenase-like cupin family protein